MEEKEALKTKTTRNERLKDVMFSHNFSHSKTIPTWQSLNMHVQEIHMIQKNKQTKKKKNSKQLMAWVSSNLSKILKEHSFRNW